VSEDGYDVIVVGAGLAGLCCAGELVLRGLRPLLVCETKEVGSTIRSSVMGDGNIAVPQVATWQVGWGGGWWFNLARELNVAVSYHPEPELDVTVWDGSTPGPIHRLARCTSASGVTNLLEQFAPWPIDAVRDEFERLMAAGLAIPPDELMTMDSIPLGQWLREEQGATEIGAYAAAAMLSQISMMDAPTTLDKVSVFGAFGFLRTYVCGEGALIVLDPDNREGLAIPLAREIERRGGKVLRQAKVKSVSTAGGEAGLVTLVDGTELSAPVVAIAAGNRRVETLFDQRPPEIEPALEAPLDITEVYTYTLLDKVVTSTNRAFLGVLGPDGANLSWSWDMNAFLPGTVKPGYQLVVATATASPDKLAEAGGKEGLYKRLNDVHEAYFPGFKDAIVEQKRTGHHHLWYDQIASSPKLPRKAESVENLWFVGEGSAPIAGFGFEAACSAGILGARAIVESRQLQGATSAAAS
jgi:phytoene dehydrogenase-like protein